MAAQINEVEQKAIHKFTGQVKDSLRVKKIILFGSRARGDAFQYSDIDLLVLTEKPRVHSDRAKLAEVSSEINVDYGVTLSCLYFNVDEWEHGKSINPLLKENVSKEGIELEF